MSLLRIQVANLRNLASANLELSPSFNFFVGANGAGKSSVLEAVGLLASGRSFRTSDLKEMIRHGQPSTHVFAEISIGDYLHRFGLARMRNGGFEARVDGEPLKRLADGLRLLPAQLISPESLALLAGGRRARCRFLDYGLFHVEPSFYEQWRRYERLLAQRNELLKQQGSERAIRAFDEPLTAVAEPLTRLRQDYAQALNLSLSTLAEEVANGVKLQLRFDPGWAADGASFEAQLRDRLGRDRQAGFTTVGPHRATFTLLYNGRAADEVCSRGQLKLAVTCLKLAQGEGMAQALGRNVLYLLDDVESELDRQRRAGLLQWLRAGQHQVLLTAINADAVEPFMQPGDKLFHVEHGVLNLAG